MFQESYITYSVIAAAAIFTILGVLIISIIVRIQKNNHKYFFEKAEIDAEHKQQLLQTQIEIQEQTLKTISQEIHDNIGQVLSLAKLNLNTFENIESTLNQTKINDTKKLVSKAINDLRDLSRSLHGDKIAELGLQASIENELKILENTGQFKTNLNLAGYAYKLEPQKEMVLFRIVQEALNNSIKHAKAKNIHVTLDYGISIFKLCIKDDGVGFDINTLTATKTGIGLKSMQNRAALIGATFNIESLTQQGTSITITLEKE